MSDPILAEAEEQISFVAVVFVSSRRRHTRYWRDWSSDVCSSDLSTQVSIAWLLPARHSPRCWPPGSRERGCQSRPLGRSPPRLWGRKTSGVPTHAGQRWQNLTRTRAVENGEIGRAHV